MPENKYHGIEKTAEVCVIWPTSAAAQMGKMVKQCRLTDHILATDGRMMGGAPLPSRAGFVAEEIHAETFNLDAILKDTDVRAFTDRYENSLLGNNDPTNDIVVVKEGEAIQGVQLKYYKNGQKTANAFRDTRDGIPHYQDTDTMLAPSDQVSDVKAAARKTELKNQETRPEVADAARQVQDRVTDHIEEEGVKSRPLSKKDAEAIAQGNDAGKKLHKEIQNQYKTASTIQQTVKAAGSAAFVTTVLAGTINTISCLNKVQKKQMTSEEAVSYILKNTAIAAGDSALKAGAATAVTSLTVRTLPDLFLQASTMQAGFLTGAVAGTTICAVDVIECLVMVAAGKMSWQAMEERTGKNIFQTSSGVVGSTIGAALGAPGGPVGSMIGAMIGGMITSVAMTFAIENHIEKPFQEIIQNTQSLVHAETLLTDSVSYMAEANAVFDGFQVGLFLSEKEFDAKMKNIVGKRNANWEKINKLK